jgi:hypothetical protein
MDTQYIAIDVQEQSVQEVPQHPPSENDIVIDVIFEDNPVPVPVPTDRWGVDDHHAPTSPTMLVKSLCASLKYLRKGTCLLFPIKKINNISVEVSITKENRSIYTFNIAPIDFSVEEDSLYETIYDRIGDHATRELNEDEFIEYIIENVLATLKKIKIDKLNGQFSTTQQSPKFQKIDEMWTTFCQEFKEDEHLALSINECCVCFTATKTTTNCGHTVCLECISKLRTEPVADDQTRHLKYISCPMCRQRIQSL